VAAAVGVVPLGRKRKRREVPTSRRYCDELIRGGGWVILKTD
jgi:hypothetical protein